MTMHAFIDNRFKEKILRFFKIFVILSDISFKAVLNYTDAIFSWPPPLPSLIQGMDSTDLDHLRRITSTEPRYNFVLHLNNLELITAYHNWYVPRTPNF